MSGPLRCANYNSLAIGTKQAIVSDSKRIDSQAHYMNTADGRDGRPHVTVNGTPLHITSPSGNGTGKGTVELNKNITYLFSCPEKHQELKNQTHATAHRQPRR